MLSEAGIDASKVSVLDKGEMVKTEGEFAPLIWLFWATVAANAPTHRGEIYHPNNNGYVFTPTRRPVNQAINWDW